MSHRIPPQSDCAHAWLAAAKFVNDQAGREAYNVMFDVLDPTRNLDQSNSIVCKVETFLNTFDKSLFSIANTIFPNGLYRRYGMPDFMEVFYNTILPRVRRTNRWSGYYFERMTGYPTIEGGSFNQLENIIGRIRNPAHKARNKFEISIFDPERDVDNSPYGGQCLSHLSFKLLPGTETKLALTAIYRNHYYIEKLLGNLIGLGWLMAFVAKEGGVSVGQLTVLSTRACIDQPGQAKRNEIDDLFRRCTEAPI